MSEKRRINILTFTDEPEVEYQLNDAVGNNSFAYGEGLTAEHPNTVIFGKYNRDNPNVAFAIGGGQGDGNRKNIF